MNNIQKTVDAGLCISCGVCSANCPKSCIVFELKNGMYQPKAREICINCGRCLQVCPSENMETDINTSDITSYVLGNCQQILKAKIRNKSILNKATSGGVVTGMISELLITEKYCAAFVVVDYDYHRYVKTGKVEEAEVLLQSCGSRYLPVSQADAVKYICENRDKRVIIVATSCALTAIEKSITLNHLRRENYLLIGLFCDKTMHYGVVNYFDRIPELRGHRIKEFYFRSKVGSAWPGKVRIVLDNQEVVLLPSSARKKLKDYFVPERCLYCVDKLNRNADISVGDNYIKENADEEGISSVIIRTDMGFEAWNDCASLFEWSQDEKMALLDSQQCRKKEENYEFGCLKGVYPRAEVSREIRKKYLELMRRKNLGASEDPYTAVSRDIRKRQLIVKVKAGIKKFLKE